MHSNLNYIINHVFLPPQLPQRDDEDASKDASLIENFAEALSLFKTYIPHHEIPGWSSCIKMAKSMLELRAHSGDLVPENVVTALREMTNRDILPLHIRAQNAGLIIRRSSDQYSFESFELSPTNGAVIGTIGRLRRCFPGPAIAIGQDRIADINFLEPLADLLAKLDAETLEEAMPIVRKANSEVVEIRDTAHPRFVTEMLTGILRAIGQPMNVSRIYKHTREDVLWKDALQPWRRSPMWLFLRVTLQTSLLGTDDKKSCLNYKFFMVFFMANVLESALDASLPTDKLFIMTAKISRRVLKLGALHDNAWLEYVEKVVGSAQQEMARRWELVEKNSDPLMTQRNWHPSKLSFLNDTTLTISKLRPYLASVLTRPAVTFTSSHFTSACGRRILQSSSELPDLSLLSGVGSDSVSLHVVDLERWVCESLDSWLFKNVKREDASTNLTNLMKSYTTVASSAYVDKPEDISLMLLTLMDLWIALDKCALHHCPLLHDYNPGFPPSLFEPLLLPRKSQMGRLLLVEQYLELRRKQAKLKYPSIFKSVATANSFSVQYFQQSPHHQELRRMIEAKASTERTQKRAELARKSQQYRDLMDQSDRLSCEYVTRQRKRRESLVHSGSCQKCRLRATAHSLSIEVHEWPLPNKDLQAKAVVFELDLPNVICKWRDTTYCLLVDTFSIEPGQKMEPEVYTLYNYAGVSEFINSREARVQLASTAKSFLVSHYRSKQISQATETNVCVNNGLHYSLYDSKKGNWTKELLDCFDIREKCTPKLADGPYRELQYTLNNTVHTSNDVIAGQDKCPAALTLHEFYAFGALRSGHRLQWRNIIRELTTHILNFSRQETHALITQAAWQAGPFGEETVYRESHVDLEEEGFGISLASTLGDAISAVESNWQGAVAVRTFIVLASRLLSFSTCNAVREDCARFLRRAREISLRWTREIGQKLQEEQREKERRTLNMQTLEMALTCYGTFDVELHQLQRLFESDEDVAIATECSIIVHDRCPAVIKNVPKPMKVLLQRHWRISCSLESILRDRILGGCVGLDNTLRLLWGGYKSGSPWKAMEAPSERWLMTKLTSEDGVPSMLVHYNLLDGSLLVNGSPLTRLPKTYEAHPTFLRLFGEKVLDVVPSDMSASGMVFAARNLTFGHELHFGMHGSELIIQARREGQIYELLPLHALNSDFPCALVQDYAHWLDIKTASVKWQPLANPDPWTQTSQSWHMQSGSPGEYSLIQASLKLIDLHKPTAKAVSETLSPLEDAVHIHITFTCEAELLEVHLPRLKLDFFLRKGATQLESKQFRGMIVDTNQSFGTLAGLVNKLVLRGSDDSARTVIIPHGKVSFRPEGCHVSVLIERSTQHLSYHLYQIDDRIGRLVDDGSLQSKLFLCYLHAITAHCLTDELTGRTGTEEALYSLGSPSVRSFLRLEQIEIDILLLLAQLTPRREYYPQDLRVMQTVKWKKLSPLSQHSSFSKLAQSIFEQADMYGLFHENSLQLPNADICGNRQLLERAAIRNASYHVHGFGAEDHTTKRDVVYVARDYTVDSQQESLVHRTASLVERWSVDLKCCSNLLLVIRFWGQTLDGCREYDAFSLGYDMNWLDPLDKFLPAGWCTLQSALSHIEVDRDKYRVMMFLSTLSYSQHANQELIETLLAFATVPKLRGMNPPDFMSFDLEDGFAPNRSILVGVTGACTREFYLCPEYDLPPRAYETPANLASRRKDEYEEAVEERVSIFIDGLLSQWPTANICDPSGNDLDIYISVREATNKARVHFCSWFRNAKFQEYIAQAQSILDSLDAGDQQLVTLSFSQPQYQYCPGRSHVELGDLMERSAPIFSPARPEKFDSWVCQEDVDQADHSKLNLLLGRLLNLRGGYEKRYVDDLARSVDSLQSATDVKLCYSPATMKPFLGENLIMCKNYVNYIYRLICHSLQAESSITRRISCTSKMWPRLSRTTLLQSLASDKVASLPEDWKSSLIKYGLAISALQRTERLWMCAGSSPDLLNELKNQCHLNWDPYQYPDWLLLEIENSISVRPVQAEIAREMISPSAGANSIMQLNMGEGKSSVIVPIVAATLADGKMLVRVVVLKPLSTQMFQLLLTKLSGMLGRRIFHMPISRSVRLDEHKARQIRNLCEECVNSRGILLVQPEHLLSFELMGLERVLSGETELGSILTETQHWLEGVSRDILDESDEILSVRFELIYTMGMQSMVEFAPDRWAIIEHVLGIVGHFANEVLDRFPHGLEREPMRPGSFPRIRILQSSAGHELLKIVARQVCKVGLPGVPVWNLPKNVRKALSRYLTDLKISEADVELLNSHVFNVSTMEKSVFLLRGLVADGVLAFTLQQKRWRVNYGLDLSRTMLAVPYRAKDSPATRAEFSHPDATIVLTCLSYYYGGLSDDQLYVAFEKLLVCDHSQVEYERWVHDAPELPASSRQLRGVNLKDAVQCSQVVFPALRLAKGAIDFYLSNIVFPKEMKEFPKKLSSSGWDIAREKVHPTTGFSGTNDSRYILPLSVSQCDLPKQVHTNALVLDHLLRPENSFKSVTVEPRSEIFNAESLLQLVIHSESPVRVILDVGAQVLEWTNEQVAHEWLARVPVVEAQAVIFFDDDNDLSVLDRDGNTESLMMSPFAKQMDQCLVYLDEAHTRGTDLKLPTNYRAAVTLGPDLTKDRLVQACMRMRKLGKGQSVMFCGPNEVERKILSCSQKSSSDTIEVEDVLQWTISETCIYTRKSVPLWAIQGLRHQRRLAASSQSSKGEGQNVAADVANSLLEAEAQSLKARYGTEEKRIEDQVLLHDIKDASLSEREAQINAIQEKCQEFELTSFNNAALREEQERELSPESEQERQVERPLALIPHVHNVHPDVKHFVGKGVLNRPSDAFQPAFSFFKKTSAVKDFEIEAWPTNLLITADFARTVKTSNEEHLDSYVRPVNWVVSRKENNLIKCVVLSPFEAHELLPIIRQGKATTLHIYSPRTNMSTRLLEDLAFCAIPAVPQPWSRPPFVMHLNLFAGQLYLRNYDEYLSLCQFLGLCFRPPSTEVRVASDSFVRPADRARFDALMAKECPFKVSPIGFLRALMSLRRKGQSFERSHMGSILYGGLLTKEHFPTA